VRKKCGKSFIFRIVCASLIFGPQNILVKVKEITRRGTCLSSVKFSEEKKLHVGFVERAGCIASDVEH